MRALTRPPTRVDAREQRHGACDFTVPSRMCVFTIVTQSRMCVVTIVQSDAAARADARKQRHGVHRPVADAQGAALTPEPVTLDPTPYTLNPKP